MASDHNTDKALERLLRQSSRMRTDKVAAGSCLDADTLAAWADGTLTATDLAAAEAHASSCDRCLALLAAMERASPPVAVSKRWWSYGPIRWLVPLTAAVTVVAVWIAVPRDQRPTVSEQIALPADKSSTGLPADSSTVAMPDAKVEAPSATSGVTGARGAGGLSADSSAVASPDAKTEARSAKADARAATGARGATGAERARGAVDRVIAGSAGRVADVSPDSSVVASPGAMAEVPPPQASPIDPSRARERAAIATTPQELGASPAPSRAAPPAAVTLSETIQTSGAMRLARRAPIQIISPNRSIRWRAIGGFVERSTDGGTRWTATSAQLPVDLTAGVSPLPSVVWLVGSGGTVLLSTDGIQFRVVPFPERVDLTAVRATDARNATITTLDGRTFATADGGATWLEKP